LGFSEALGVTTVAEVVPTMAQMENRESDAIVHGKELPPRLVGSNYVTCRGDRLLGLAGEEFETAFVWHAVRGGQASRQHDPVISSVMLIISSSYHKRYMLTGKAQICRNEANKSFVINGSDTRSASTL
jgi:hypothetical protein